MPWNRFTNQEGLVYIASASPSAASTVSFDNVFTTSFTSYRIHYNLTLTTGGQALWIRFRSGGVDATGAATMGSVASYLNVITGALTSNVSGSGGDNKMLVGRITTNMSGGAFDIHGPQKASYTSITGVTWSAHVPSLIDGTGYYVGGQQATSNQFDGITLFPTSSTMTGFISVYGYTE